MDVMESIQLRKLLFESPAEESMSYLVQANRSWKKLVHLFSPN